MSNGVNKSLLFALIENNFLKYQNYIRQGKLFDNIKIKMFDFILLTPSDNNLFVDTFNINRFNNTHFEKLNALINKRLNLEEKFNIYTNDPICIKEFEIIEESISMKKNMVYLLKRGKHITNLFQRIRNSLAHGNYYINDNRIVLWNISGKNNISFFANISLLDFKYLHKKLIELTKN